jgi:hypothetical protein
VVWNPEIISMELIPRGFNRLPRSSQIIYEFGPEITVANDRIPTSLWVNLQVSVYMMT